jgi:ATP-binding protein involved in chromosome partitioning
MADTFALKGAIIDAIGDLKDPLSGKSLLDAHMVEEVDVTDEGKATIRVQFSEEHTRDHRWQLEDSVCDAAEGVEGITEATVLGFTPGGAEAAAAAPAPATDGPETTPVGDRGAPAPKPAPAVAPPTAEALKGVGRVIAVASGKGGVGKSTVAVNLALALRRLGFSVGLLDIDIYGPSLPTLLGINERPNVMQRRIVPPEAHGLRLMSLGFLMDEDTPVIWRGPIVTGIVRQFLQDVDWEGTDYLVVDLPPGTGDAQLSLAQTVPVDAAIVVTTPSDLALVDAARGLRMFNTLNVDVLGIVENMAYFVWPGAAAAREAITKLKATGADASAVEALEKTLAEHERMFIFGKDGGSREAERLGTPFLGQIPLDQAIRAGGDEGKPIMLAEPDGPIGAAFVALAEKVAQAKPLERENAEPRKGMFSFLKS